MKLLMSFSFLVFCCFVPNKAQAKIKSKPLAYQSDFSKHLGFLVWNTHQKIKSPGVLIFPEWWGLNSDMKQKAHKMAQLGYMVFVADIYGHGKFTDNPTDAAQLLGGIQGKSIKYSRQSFMAAYLTFMGQKNLNTNKVAIVGYGFGGSLAMDMARRGIRANGLVNFFGPVRTNIKIKPGTIRPEILWIKGQDDSWIEKSMEDDFKKEMSEASARFQVITYPNTFHSFTNPEASSIARKHRIFLQYSPESTKKSWAELNRFLKKVLK